MDLDKVAQRSVAYCYIHNYTVMESWAFSTLRLHVYDERNRKLLEGVGRSAGPYHVRNREALMQMFYQSPMEWSLWVDTNNEFEPDVLYKLLAVADPDTAPIVVANYASRPGLSGDGTDPPLLWMWYDTNENNEFVTVQKIEGGPSTHIQRIKGAGMGMVLIHRSILDKFPEAEYGRGRWFGHDVWTVNGEVTELGEDLTFFHRCRLAGIPVYGYRGVELIHWKMRREKVSDINATELGKIEIGHE